MSERHIAIPDNTGDNRVKSDNYDEWLEYFVMDHNISPNNVIYEGIVDGKMFHMTYRELFEKVHDYCYNHGFTIYPGKISTTNTFRLCALGAIDTPDIEAFFKVLREAFEAHNIALPARYK